MNRGLGHLRVRLWAAAAALLLGSAPAQAHLVSTGLGPLGDGFTHFALSPEDFLPVLALALWAGLRGEQTAANALFTLPLAWLTGGTFGLIIGSFGRFPYAGASCLILGAAVAADWSLPPLALTAVAGLTGLLLGFLNGAGFAASGGFLAIFGAAAAGFIAIALLSAFTVSLKPGWPRIIVRVAGSWIAAVGLLLIGWFIHAAPARS